MPTRHQRSLSSENPSAKQDPASPAWKEVDTGKIGVGALSTREIKEGEIICEYLGQIISEDEALVREQEYEKNKMPVTLVKLNRRKWLDGNRSADGTLISIKILEQS